MRRVETQSIRDVAIRKRATEVVGDQRIGALLFEHKASAVFFIV
jgi:hypothetical protein